MSHDDLWQPMQAGLQLGDDYTATAVAARLQAYTGDQHYFDPVTERAAQIDYDELRSLKPGCLQWAAHPGHPQTLLPPTESAKRLLAGTGNIG